MNPLEVLFSEEDKQNIKNIIERKNPGGFRNNRII